MRRLALFACGAALGLVLATLAAGPLADTFGFSAAAHKKPPVSSMEPLPDYVQSQVVYANFTSTVRQGGIRWTELWYQRNGAGYAAYRPPWNPKGHWVGTPIDETDHDDDDDPKGVKGTIPFDTFFTGGEGQYDFYTIAVAKGKLREPTPSGPKASTIVDATAPEVAVSRPSPNSWTTAAIVEWTATDGVSGVEAVEIALDGSPVGPPQPPSGVLTLPNLASGSHSLKITAEDRAGNARRVVVPFSFDPNAPAVELTSPQPNAYLNRRDVRVAWTSSDSASGIDHFSLRVDSGPEVVLPGSAREHAVASVPEGIHIVSLTAVDVAGNTATAIVAFTVDATPPDIAVISPVEGAYVAGTQVTVLWSASDAVSGIARYEVALDLGAPVSLPGAGAYSFPDVPEGLHRVSVRAVDRAGNAREAFVNAILDATAPQFIVLSPVPGGMITGAVTVSWRVADLISGVDRVELSLDGATAFDVTGRTTHTFDAPAMGSHSVTLRAVDRAGNEGEVAVTFTSVTLPPAPTEVAPVEFWTIVAIMAIAGFGYAAVRQRDRPRR